MKIVKLSAEDILRLKAVEITPDPNAHTVVVSGNNGAGKSAVLNLMWLAMDAAAAMKILPEPVRKGAKKGWIELDLGDFLVTKKFSAKGTNSLEITTKEGMPYPSPQAMLKKLIGDLSFDPRAFADAKPREQLTMLMQALRIDLEGFEGRYKALYDERTAVNRDEKTLKTQFDSLPEVPKDTPDDLVSVKDLMAELDKNRALRDRQIALGNVQQVAESQIEKGRAEIARIEAAIITETQRLQAAENESATITYVDPAIFVKGIEELDQINDAVRAKQRRAEIAASWRIAHTKSESLSKKLEALEKEKAESIAAAGLPVEGLGFTEEGVTLNGVPFGQASSAEQLRASMAIAIAMNPKLRVIRVMDGSLLDTDSMKIIEEMAAAADYQVWVEVVSDQPLGIHIEDGEVVDEAVPVA